jgi:hypothetical protein
MSVDAERYTELMAPAFVEGLKDVYSLLREDVEIALVGFANAQQLVRSGVEAVDWNTAGLLDLVINHAQETERVIKPASQAEQLLDAAFDDAQDVLQFCEDSLRYTELPTGVVLGDVLLASKQPLLIIAELSDTDKDDLLDAVKDPAMAIHHVGKYIEPPYIVMDAIAPSSKPRFDWNSQIKDWIEAHKSEEGGCPAHKMVVDTGDGHKQILTYYFWDKLVTAMYPTS